jgi:signal transduction histidine kinase
LQSALVSADRLLEEGRNRVGRLRASELTSDNLVSGFKAVAAELNDEKHVQFDVQFDLRCEGPLSEVNPTVLGELYFIGCEAISNAFRHSHASEITVRLECLPKVVILAMSDNGVGFDWEAYKRTPNAEHWGVYGMQERAQVMHATIRFSGTPNIGTEIVITVPARRAYKKGGALRSIATDNDAVMPLRDSSVQSTEQ